MLAGKGPDWFVRGIIVTFFRKGGNDMRDKTSFFFGRQEFWSGVEK